MKKLLTILLLFTVLTPGFSKKKEKANNGPAIVYSLPKTVLVVQIEATKVVEKVGPYYKYSERYLALKDVVRENKEYWEVTNIKMYSKCTPDKSNTYTFSSGANNLVSLTPEGVICGINYPCPNEIACPATGSLQKREVIEELKDDIFDNMVLTEDQLVANSTAKMAENAAKQIYRIRDSRLSLITGDTEKMPADGESLNLMLTRMDEAESSLLELFAGKRIKKTIVKEIEIVPVRAATNEVVCRFSALNGVVDKDDLSGSPIYMNIDSYKNSVPESAKKGDESGCFYIIPGKAKVELTFNEKKYVEDEFIVAQFGSVQLLPSKVVNDGLTKVRFNPVTGGIISIEK